MGFLDFLSPESGQSRRRWLDQRTGGLLDALQYYVGPGVDVRQMGGILGMLNPVQDIGEAMGNARDGDYAGAAINTASALMPIAGAKLAGGQIADDVGNIISDTLTNVGTKAQGAMQAFAADEFGGVGPSKGIRAYHGSPHDFDRFSMDAIGTGEGAQAYGHGLYFAENEAVARGYRDKLSDPQWSPAGTYEGPDLNQDDPIERLMQLGLGQYNTRPVDEAISVLTSLKRNVVSDEILPAYDAAIERLKSSPRRSPPTPRMYEVNINANPDDFLDWDAPLSEQPRGMDAAQKLGLPRVFRRGEGEFQAYVDGPSGFPEVFTGATQEEAVQKAMENLTGAHLAKGDLPSLASRTMREAGIPGIKYRDAGSRGMDGDSGTRNYVVFDENLIEIVRKYGIAGAATILGVSASDVQAAMGQQQQPQGLLGSLAGVQ